MATSRTWWKAVKANLKASSTVRSAGDLITTLDGDAYVADGATADKALLKLVKGDDVPAETGVYFLIGDTTGRYAFLMKNDGSTLIPKLVLNNGAVDTAQLSAALQAVMPQTSPVESGYAWSVTGPSSRIALGVTPDGTVKMAKIALPAGSVDTAQLSAAIQAGVMQTLPVESGYLFAIVDSAGRIGWGVTPAGLVVASKSASGYSLRESVNANYRTVPYIDGNGRYQFRVTRRSDGWHVFDTAGQAWDSVEPVLDPAADKVLYRSNQTGTLTDLWVPAAGGTSLLVTPPQSPLDAYGDSLTNGNGSTSPATDAYPAKLALGLGILANNYGIPGQVTAQIAARMGAVPANVTLPGNKIPGGTAATITVSALDVLLLSTPGTNTARSLTGTIAGVHGTLLQDGTGTLGTPSTDTYKFTPDAAPAADVPVPAGTTPFIPDAGVTSQQRLIALWTGRNDLTPGNLAGGATLTAFYAQVDAMMNWQKTYQRRVILLGITTGAGETTGTANHDNAVAVNNQLATTYGGSFLDVRRYLIDNALTIMAANGITPTSQDTTDIAGDTIPASLRADNIHFTTVTYQAIADYIKTNLRTQRKWY